MFDFLSNIASKAKSAIGSVFQQPLTPSPSSMEFRVGQGLDPVQTKVAQSVVTNKPLAQQTMAPNMSTNLGPAAGSIGSNSISYNTPRGAATISPSSLSGNSTPYYPANPGMLPPSLSVKPYVAPVTRQATTPTSAPYAAPGGGGGGSWAPYISGGNMMVDPRTGRQTALPQAQSGLSGSGGQAFNNALSGMSGDSGVGGGRFSVGGSPLGTYNSLTTPDMASEEEKKKGVLSGYKYNPVTGQIEPVSPTGAPVNSGAPVVPPAPPATPPTGGMAPTTPTQTIGERFVGKSIEKPLSAPTLPATLDSSELEKYITGAQAYANAPGSKSNDDLAAIQGNLKHILDIGVENIMKSKGLTPDKNVVEDSPELQDFMSQLEGNDRFNYQNFADSFRTQNGMSDWLKLKESGKAAIQVMTKEYNDIISSIKSNPDLPKGLKQRRMEAFKEHFDSVVGSAKEDIASATNAIEDINNSLNSQLGIVTAQRSEDDRKRQANLDVFKTLIDSGADFSNADKASWAKRLGLSVGALDNLARKAKGDNVGMFQDSNGQQVFYDKTTLKEVSRLGTAKSTTGTGSTSGLDVNDPISQQFMMIAPKTPGAYAIALSQFNALNGNPMAQQKWIENEAKKGMPTGQQSQFVGASKLVNDTQRAMSAVDTYTGSSGVYKSLKNKAAPFATLEQDQAYNTLKQQIQGFQAQKINELYGAALTGAELSRANDFFVDFSTDSISTIKTKMTSMNQLASADKNFYLQTAMGNLDAGTTPSAVTPQSSSVDDMSTMRSMLEGGTSPQATDGGSWWDRLKTALSGGG